MLWDKGTKTQKQQMCSIFHIEEKGGVFVKKLTQSTKAKIKKLVTRIKQEICLKVEHSKPKLLSCLCHVSSMPTRLKKWTSDDMQLGKFLF